MAEKTRTHEEEQCREALGQLANGNIDALAVLYRAYGASVYAIARQMTGSKGDAEDLAQDVWLRVAERAGRYDGRYEPRVWVFAVTRHLAIDRLRTRREDTPLDALTDDRLPENCTVGDGTPAMEIAEALATLSPDDRFLVEMKIHYGFTHAELAKVMGLTVFAVKKRYSRALQVLRRYWKENDDEKA